MRIVLKKWVFPYWTETAVFISRAEGTIQYDIPKRLRGSDMNHFIT